MSTTEIEWCDKVWNPLIGCTRISEGCRNCYAERMAGRLAAMGQSNYAGVVTGSGPKAHWNGRVKLVEAKMTEPLHWKKPARIFVNSMSDLFHANVPDEWIDRVFAVMALCPAHTFMVLTKRPERMAEYFTHVDYPMQRARQVYGDFYVKLRDSGAGTPCDGEGWPLPNVWLGTSVENRKALERIMHLAACPAAVRFVSGEPLLEDLGQIRGYLEQLTGAGKSMLIAGCESGPRRRPMEAAWVQSMADQCKAAGVTFFMKQMDVSGKVCGELEKFPVSLRVREFPKP